MVTAQSYEEFRRRLGPTRESGLSYIHIMSERDDPRPRAAVTLAPLAPEPRTGLLRASQLGVRAVQLSAGQPGTRPRDLDRSGRRDLLVAARRLELELGGIDAWFSPEALRLPLKITLRVCSASVIVPTGMLSSTRSPSITLNWSSTPKPMTLAPD